MNFLIAILKFVFLFVVGLNSQSALAEKITFEKVYENPDIVWGFEFVDNNKILINHRNGTMTSFDLISKKAESVSHSFKIFEEGQGGLLDVAKDTDYEKNRILYFTYSTTKDKGKENTTRLAQARWDKNQLFEIKDLYTANAWSKNNIHFGSRIAVAKDVIYFSVGERNERNKAWRWMRQEIFGKQSMVPRVVTS